MLELTNEPLDKMEQRFLKRVQKTPTCWLWTGGTFKQRYGYGTFNLYRVDKERLHPTRAHRVAYALWVRDIAPHEVVAHHCYNPPWVNPAHLWITDQAGNLADMRTKNRHATKLTEAQVREIRARHDPKLRNGARLAREYGVDTSTVHYIISRKLW